MPFDIATAIPTEDLIDKTRFGGFEKEEQPLSTFDLKTAVPLDELMPSVALEEKRKRWEKEASIGPLEAFRRQDKTELIPFNPEGMVKSVSLLTTVRRLQRNEYDEPEQKKRDEKRMYDFLEKSEEERIRGYSVLGNATRIVMQLPGYAIEFLATGGIAAFGKKGAQKATAKVLGGLAKKKVAKLALRGIGWTAGGIARTTVMPHRVGRRYAERQINSSLKLTEEGLEILEESSERPYTSFWKAAGDIVIENMSEVAGAEIGRIGGKIVSKVVPRRMAIVLTREIRRLHPTRKVSEFMAKAGYHGVLEEIGEERLGDLMRAVTGVEDFGKDNVFDRILASVPERDQVMAELVAFSVPMVAGKAVSLAQRTKAIRTELKKEGYTDLEIEEVVEEVERQEAAKMAPKAPKEEIMPEAIPEAERVIKTTEEGLIFDFKADVKEAVKQDVETKKSQLDIEIEQMTDRLMQVEAAKMALEEGGKVKKFLQGRVRRFKKGYLAEEMRAFPKRFFTTKEEALPPDEALEEVNKAGLGVEFENLKELADFLRDWERQEKSLKATIEELRPKLVTRKETTVLKEKIRNIQRGIREGTIKTKKQIKATQTKVIDIIEKSGLEAKDRAKFIRTIKNVQTSEQLEKALPKIEERIVSLGERAEKSRLVDEIVKLSKADVPLDYREQIDGILAQYDMKARTEKTKRARESRLEFLEREIENGNLAFLPASFWANLGRKTLDEMSLEELEDIHSTIQILAYVGRTKGELLARKEARDLEAQVGESVGNIYETVGKEEQKEDRIVPLVPPSKKGRIRRMLDTIDGYFAAHRKVEFISKDLKIADEIFETIQEGINKELVDSEEYYQKLKDAFALIDVKHVDKEETIEGIPVPLTREQMTGIALNSENRGNLDRLKRGNKFTDEQIKLIKGKLTENEKKFVNAIFELVEEPFAETVRTTAKMAGVKVKKIAGRYFPIAEDYELSKRARMREAEKDLFQDIFQTTFINRSFTKERRGGVAPVDLNVFAVIMKHIDKVVHYNSLAIPVRDVQKIIRHPRFEKAIKASLGENVYNQFPMWLRDIANPKGEQSGNNFDKIAMVLRNNSTVAILGHKISVSFLQVCSYTQTVKEIRVPASINGILQFYKNPRAAIEFVYERSPIMKNRSKRFDREIKDWLRRGEAQKIIRGKKGAAWVLFSFIRGVDFVTTMPTWLGAYEKNFSETKNQEEAVVYADGVVRRTQPTGAIENLPSVMRGGPWRKLFTMFMTHFTNMHNQIVSAKNELKYDKAHPMRKSVNFARSMFWLWVAPSMLAAFIRAGGSVDDWRKYVKELILYPFSAMILVRDLMGSIVKGFDFGAPAGLSGFKELSYAAKGKRLKTKLKHGAKAAGMLTGKIPIQYVDMVVAIIDMLSEETDDFRRLVWSERALRKEKEELPKWSP